MIIRRSRFQVVQMVARRSAQKISNRNFRQQFRASVQCLDGKLVVLILSSHKCEIAIGFSEFGPKLYGEDKLPLGIRSLFLPQQSLPQKPVKFRIIRMCRNQGAVSRFRLVILSRSGVQLCKFTLRRFVCRT